MYVYKITNLRNQKVYVGCSQGSPEVQSRWRAHRYAARSPTQRGDQIITKAIRKYGIDCFVFEVVEVVDGDVDVLHDREACWIAKLNASDPKKGYNRTPGGRTVRWALSRFKESHSRAVSRANSRRWAALSPEVRAIKTAKLRFLATSRAPEEASAIAKIASDAARVVVDRSYKICDPLGKAYSVTGLRSFCRKHGLIHQNMIAVSQGEQSHHKGWICRRVDLLSGSPIETSVPPRRTSKWIFKDPAGTVHEVEDLKNFCSTHALPYTHFARKSPRSFSHKGWILVKRE